MGEGACGDGVTVEVFARTADAPSASTGYQQQEVVCDGRVTSSFDRFYAAWSAGGVDYVVPGSGSLEMTAQVAESLVEIDERTWTQVSADVWNSSMGRSVDCPGRGGLGDPLSMLGVQDYLRDPVDWELLCGGPPEIFSGIAHRLTDGRSFLCGTELGEDRTCPGVGFELVIDTDAQLATGNPDDPFQPVHDPPPVTFVIAFGDLDGEVIVAHTLRYELR